MATGPRITFGIIVLNGEPFTRYCIRSLYPYAHQIIVVEGAAPAAARIATPDGHSVDRTLEVLRAMKEHEDPEDKLCVITAEDEGHPDGFWPGEKDEQSQAYAKRATGDYLWQVDIDEFYRAEDMQRVLAMLAADPAITAVSFEQITFWGGFDYTTDSWYLRRGAAIYHRLFRWGDGYRYVTHRPPTVHDNQGRDLRRLKWIDGKETARHGVRLYHYSLLFPKQVEEKCAYYQDATWAQAQRASEWAQSSYLSLKNPFRVHNVYQYPSWLARFRGRHPAEVQRMREDIAAGVVHVELRRTDDVEQVLASFRYAAARAALKLLDPVDRAVGGLRRWSNRLLGIGRGAALRVRHGFR